MAADRSLYAPDLRLHAVHNAVVAAVAAQLGPLAELNSVAVPWFSATFEGVRHTLRFGAVAPEQVAALETQDVALPCDDYVIVSVGTKQDGARARIKVLTISCG